MSAQYAQIGAMAASTYMSMKSSREAGIQAEIEGVYREQDLKNQRTVAEVRSAETLLDINDRWDYASSTLNNNADIYSGSGLAKQNRMNTVAKREIAANKTNTGFEIANINIGITSNTRATKYAKKSANMQATAAFFNFGSQVAGGFSGKAAATKTGGKKIDTSKYKQGHLPWQNTNDGL